MYVVFVSGGKQYWVVEGDILKLEMIDVEFGLVIEFDQVLLVVNGDDVKIGVFVVEGGMVKVEVVIYGCGEKVKIIKFCCCKYYCK